MLPVTSDKNLNVMHFLHNLRYVGVGVFNTHFRTFLQVVSHHVHIVHAFVVSCSTFTSYVRYVLSCSSYLCAAYNMYLYLLTQKLPSL